MAARPEPSPGGGFGQLLPWHGERVKAAWCSWVFVLCRRRLCLVRGPSARGVLWNSPCGAGGCLGAWGAPRGSRGSRISVLGCRDLCPCAPCARGMDGQRSVLLWRSWRAEGEDGAGSLCGSNSDMAAGEAEPRLGWHGGTSEPSRQQPHGATSMVAPRRKALGHRGRCHAAVRGGCAGAARGAGRSSPLESRS